jgi:hypothetical protein
MPVEIREMVVKAIVPPKNVAPQEENPAQGTANDEPLDHAHIVEECVAAVLRIIEKKERR